MINAKGKSGSVPARNVDEYLAQTPEDVRGALEKLSNERVAGFMAIFADSGPAESTCGVTMRNQRSSPNVSANTVMAAAQAVPCADG